MIIVGVDPGDSTGFVSIQASSKPYTGSLNKKSFEPVVHKINHEAIYKFPAEMESLLSHVNMADVVVIEDFINRKEALGVSPIAIKVIGVVQFFCYRKNIPVVFQQPSEKGRMPDSRMKDRHDYYHKSLHVRDAMRHTLIYLTKNLIEN